GRTLTRAEVKLLGTMPDAAVGKRIGISGTRVCYLRQCLGIPRFDRRGSGPRRRWPFDALLGTVPDADIAAKFRCSRTLVMYRRSLLGISTFGGNLGSTQARMWSPDEDRLLGTMTDAAAAARIGCTRTQVALRRHARGIAGFGPREWSPAEDKLLGT